MRIAAIILAAGESRRMGRDKALLPWREGNSSVPETTLLEAISKSAATVAEAVVIVAGKNAGAIIATMGPSSGVEVIVNDAPERGMFSSLQCGASVTLARGVDAGLVFHVDRPPVRPETLRLLAQQFDRAAKEVVASVPSYKGEHGHPYLVSSKLLEEIVAAPVHANARDLMHAKGRVEYVECEDPAIVLNMNTVEDYARAANNPVER